MGDFSKGKEAELAEFKFKVRTHKTTHAAGSWGPSPRVGVAGRSVLGLGLGSGSAVAVRVGGPCIYLLCFA